MQQIKDWFRPEFRATTNPYGPGYRAQIRYWFWPFWQGTDVYGATIEKLEENIEKELFVQYLGKF